MAKMHSKPHKAEKPGISTTNRSLERGIDIIRAFRQGSNLLGNGEIAERTGLSKSTVSRLTQTLVACGMLQVEAGSRSYRLAPLVLSLAHSMRGGSRVLAIAAPIMKITAERYKINVGLASPDQDEMVYLESIRYNRRASLRRVVSGQRVPMELTSLGRAYLAVAPQEQRTKLFDHFTKVRGQQWPSLLMQIKEAKKAITSLGYCAASWQPEVLALAVPLSAGGHLYSLNVSVSSDKDPDQLTQELAPILMSAHSDIIKKLDMY